MFGNKNALFHNLKEYFEYIKNEERLYEIIPKTYYLEKDNKLGIREFYQREFGNNSNGMKDIKSTKNKNIWIVKPA
jgi:hypothetical protein